MNLVFNYGWLLCFCGAVIIRDENFSASARTSMRGLYEDMDRDSLIKELDAMKKKLVSLESELVSTKKELAPFRSEPDDPLDDPSSSEGDEGGSFRTIQAAPEKKEGVLSSVPKRSHKKSLSKPESHACRCPIPEKCGKNSLSKSESHACTVSNITSVVVTTIVLSTMFWYIRWRNTTPTPDVYDARLQKQPKANKEASERREFEKNQITLERLRAERAQSPVRQAADTA